MPKPAGPIKIITPVTCDGLTIFLNEKGETVKLASCSNEAVYGYGVAFRNYCQDCSPGKADQ